MERVFAKLRQLASMLTWTTKPVKRRPIRNVRLSMEMLEQREVPAAANLLWIGPADGNWNVQANWGAIGDIGTKVPDAGDVLHFDPSLMGDNKAGTNENSVDNMAGLSVAGIVIGPGYTETVSINQALTTDTFTFNSGTIDGPATLTVNNGGTWTTGTMKGTGTTLIEAGEFTIDQATIDFRTFVNNGTVWLNGGINLAGVINNGGVFTVRDGATTIGIAPGQGAFNNLGFFRVEGPGIYSFNMATVFNNYNHTYVSNATLYLRESGSSSGEYQVLNEDAKVSFGPFARPATLSAISPTLARSVSGRAHRQSAEKPSASPVTSPNPPPAG